MEAEPFEQFDMLRRDRGRNFDAHAPSPQCLTERGEYPHAGV